MTAADETRVPICTDLDIVTARQQGRALAAELGFTPTNQILIATAISELARNIVLYAKRGEIILRCQHRSEVDGLTVIASDQGPGIADIAQAMQLGYSTSGSLGLGLPGVQQLMDEFDIQSAPGRGTTITIKKWKR